MKKYWKKVLFGTIFAFFIGGLLLRNTFASIEYAETIDLYFLGDAYQDTLELPDNYPTSKKITVGEGSNTTYKLVSGDTITLSDDGVVSVKGTKMYCTDNFCTTVPMSGAEEIIKYEEGENIVEVTTENKVYQVLVRTSAYERLMAEKIMDDYITEHITNDMSEYEKMEEFLKLMATTEYSVNHADYIGLFLDGGGDCIAASQAVLYFCDKVGIKAHLRNAIRDVGASKNHHNVAALLDGKMYIVEAGYSEPVPRPTTISEIIDGFSTGYTDSWDLYISQYDGYEKDVRIPSNFQSTVSILGEYAFYYGSNKYTVVETVTVPKEITTIEPGAFQRVPTLKNVIVESDHPNYSSEDGILYNKDQTTLYSYPSGKDTSQYTIKDGVTTIGELSFSYNDSLKEVTFPNTVTRIEAKAFYGNTADGFVIPENVSYIGDNAFGRGLGIYDSSNDLHYLVVKNKNAELGDNLCGVNQAIYGLKGSTAITYAIENNCPYGIITEDQTEFKLINDLDFSIGSAEFNADEPNMPEIIIKDGDYTLVQDKDFKVTLRKGTSAYQMGSAYITGIGKYVGYTEQHYEITEPQIHWSYDNSVVDYTGEEQSPIVVAEEGATVYYGDTIYSNLSTALRKYTEPGTYKFGVRITKPGYETVYLEDLTFTINHLDFTKAVVSDIPDYIYVGSYMAPEVTVTYEGKTLTEKEDYTISISDYFGPGEVVMTVRGKGLYDGEITKTYMIYDADHYTVAMDQSTYTVSLNGTTKASLKTNPETYIMPFLITWKSQDSSIAAIDSDGVITGKSLGTTTITGKYGAYTIKATVTVSDTLKGDMNSSGKIELADFILGLRYYLDTYNNGEGMMEVYDMNGNNKKELGDAILILRAYLYE